ncbi:MAG: NUDIX domain-containing protein [Clostridiales bacterium]|nr:NUDIX domain-containing protein [Clostridiales bacterium]
MHNFKRNTLERSFNDKKVRVKQKLGHSEIEQGETKEQALIRECKEELNITLNVGDVFMEVNHEYPDITVHLTLFNATIAEGVLQKLEYNDIKWITAAEISNYDFCPADEEILKILKQKVL